MEKGLWLNITLYQQCLLEIKVSHLERERLRLLLSLRLRLLRDLRLLERDLRTKVMHFRVNFSQNICDIVYCWGEGVTSHLERLRLRE